jgi:copper transport protein
VLRTALRWRAVGWTRLLLFDYARVAVWLVVAVIATGTVQGLLLVPTAAELLGTDYGRLLLAKLAVVVLVIGSALLARRRLRRPLRTGDRTGEDGRASRPVGRAVRVEIVALVGVLALTGALTSLTPPAQASAGAALPPPPVGPAVPVATLAGQVTVSATASAGRLVLRLATPLDGPYDEPAQSPRYGLTARTGAEDELALVSCGTGCFTAPVDWRPGTTPLALDVDAGPWPGGRAHLDIPWPPRPAAERLDRVLAAMRAVGPFTLREATTSDYRGDPGEFRELPMTGADFVAGAPYAEGAIDPVAVSGADGDRLAFAFPANGIVVQLRLDDRDRIASAVLVSPNHLITRTFGYPPPQ